MLRELLIFGQRFRRPSKTAVFFVLMAASAVSILLPCDLLRPVTNIIQLLMPVQQGVRQGAQYLTRPAKKMTESTITQEQYAEALSKVQALQNQNASFRQSLAQLRSANAELTGIRQRGLPARGLLIPARVIALDAAVGRDSLLINKGRPKNVNSGDWVTSRLFLDAGKNDQVQEQSAVLAREYLIGWIDQTSATGARVVLLSDKCKKRPIRVHIARVDQEYEPLDAGGQPKAFALAGAGRGQMLIRDIEASLVNSGQIRIGDLVTSDPNNPELPLAMVIGEITQLNHNKKKPLLYNAVVEHGSDPRKLDHVIVVNLSAAP